MQKSKVFFSKGCKVRDKIAGILGVPIGCLPLKCLGLPLTISYPKARNFSSLIDKVRGRTKGWNLNHLSMAGKIELTKCVLRSLIWLLGLFLPTSLFNFEGIR